MDVPRQPKTFRRRTRLGITVIIVAVTALTVASRLRPSAPSVPVESVVTDTVRFGTLRVEVRAAGRLVPEEWRWVSAETAGRVERRNVASGARVTEETILIEMSNPDVQLEALEAERQLAQARADLQDLRTEHDSERLALEILLATATTRYEETHGSLERAAALGAKGFLSKAELERLASTEREAARHAQLQKERVRLLNDSFAPRVRNQEAQIQRMRAIVSFQKRRLASLRVPAGAVGVVQEVLVEEGQWVTSGAPLARIVRPGRLKAVLRVAEAHARDIGVGQRVRIDLRREQVGGRIARIDPGVQSGAVLVDVTLEGALPRSALPELSVDGVIEVTRLDGVLHVRRPIAAAEGGTAELFRVRGSAGPARRVPVRFGRVSADAVEIRSGLSAGDVVILSDMSQWAGSEQVRLK